MKAIATLLLILCFGQRLLAQQQTIAGNILDNKGTFLPFATAALLHTADSTLAYFGITNDLGAFEIKNVKSGSYLLQTSYLGYKPYYKAIAVPLANQGKLPAIVMEPDNRDLKEVEIAAERVPMLIKGDTIEYNAGAFKTQANANVEELLKKLPGVAVDRAGNVKAQGEDVKRILVDGKEFFSNDPKIATKNLPADAIKKVQVYDKTSDQADFTGIDDGNRDKTINLLLKDDKKNGTFGDLTGGLGSDNRYQGSAKVYNFNPTRQFAALGMINNINQFGFSLKDYINFRGGIGALMNGGGLQLNGSSSMPVNFGQPINGLITSGAGGVNYNYEPRKNQKLNLSYLGSSSVNRLNQEEYSENFTNNQSFTRTRNTASKTGDNGHGLSASYRTDLDSIQQITGAGSVNLSSGNSTSASTTDALLEDIALNKLVNNTSGKNKGINGNMNLNYVRKKSFQWPLLKLTANGGFDQNLSKDIWANTTTFFQPYQQLYSNQFQDNFTNKLNLGASASITKRLGSGYFMDGGLGMETSSDKYNRTQGTPTAGEVKTDSLSVQFEKIATSITPNVLLKKNNDKTQFTAGLTLELGEYNSVLAGTVLASSKYQIVLPRMRYSYEYNTGKRYGIDYNSRVTTPTVSQLQPVPNNANPLSLFKGNINLKPEQTHTAGINWLWFDQFSFTSIFANVDFTYTKDKINLARDIQPDLSQQLSFVNVNDDRTASATVEYSTPIRKLGLNMEIGLSEKYNRSLAPVNGILNINTNLTHTGELTFKNRKTEKIEVAMGVSVKYTDARYSLQGNLNNQFYNFGYFTDIHFTPTNRLIVAFSADLSKYQSRSFTNSIYIPLLQSEVTYLFMKANRASVSLKVFDILNRNSSLNRVSEMNYLQQTQSNIIGQYGMLTFTYKINKVASSATGNVDIQIKNR